ncbi:MAG: Tripartite ATP-independent periplasmic transporter [Syntrophorhabdus sp. PtaU1.Bin058]|nr:MAG: Tripartite ATP-independent periplasmic transporter [Syntrophorhabdus sp. PtaU1.Bin058]
MEKVFNLLQKVSTVFTDIGGVALTFMMCLTVADVILRCFNHPILGAYEMVALSLAIVIGFSVPRVSIDRGEVQMEILLERLSPGNRAILNTFTRILCIGLFVVIGYNLILVGNEFRSNGETSATLQIPFFPIAYCISVCCFLECFVFVFDIVKIWRGQYE